MTTPRTLPRAAAAAVALVATASVSPAHATPIAGRTQLQLQAGIFARTDLDSEVGEDELKVESTNTDTNFGILPRLGFGVGHAWSEHGMFHVLAGFSTGTSSQKFEGEDALSVDTSSVEILPSLRFVAGHPGLRGRFYVGAGIGLYGAKSETEDSTSSITAAELSGSLGVLAFLNDYVSLDPGLEITWISGKTALEVEGDEDPTSGSVSGARILLTLGLSGWLGEGKKRDGSAPAPSRGPAAQLAAIDEAPIGTIDTTVHFRDFAVQISGVPSQRGDAMRVEARHLVRLEPTWRRCELVLGSKAVTHRVEAGHETQYVSHGRREEMLAGYAPIGVLVSWVSSSPTVSVCGKEHEIEEPERVRLERTISAFVARTKVDGTHVSVPGASASESAAPAEPATAPEAAAPKEPTPAEATPAENDAASGAPTAPVEQAPSPPPSTTP